MLTVDNIIKPSNEMFGETIKRLKLFGLIPLNYSDSGWKNGNGCDPIYHIGNEDLKTIANLFANGQTIWLDYLKISLECTAPLYFWDDLEMHSKGADDFHGEELLDKPFTRDDFSLEEIPDNVVDIIVETLNTVRKQYFKNPTEENRKETLAKLLTLLPLSYNVRKSFVISYEDAAKIILSKRKDKFKEWRQLANELIMLPYMYTIVGGD